MTIKDQDKGKRVLVLIESPNKKKTESAIFKQLGYTKCIILASIGHITKIADDKDSFCNTGIYPDDGFKAKYVIDPDKKDTAKQIKDQVELADIVYVATDPDYEGSAIAYALVSQFKIKKYRRLYINAITKETISEAIEKSDYCKLRDGDVCRAQTRQKLDKLLGYRLSRIAKNSTTAKSVGRCQSAGLKLIVQREEEIQNFKSETYYDLVLGFEKASQQFKAKYAGTASKDVKRLASLKECDRIIKDCSSSDYTVVKVETKKKNVNPKPPFTTSTFQQEVSSKLGISVKKSMEYAQRLFEGIDINGQHIALITYIRTDSAEFAPEFIPILGKYVKDHFGEEYYSPIRKVKKSENEQDGHEAIRPVNLEMTPEKVSDYIADDGLVKVYRMIYARTLATMMASNVVSETTYTIMNGNHRFEFASREEIFDGFKKVYSYKDKDDEIDLAKVCFKEGETLKNAKLEAVERHTNPPSRYKEATFIKELESRGIGRPSTFATIVTTLLDKGRGYCVVENKCIVPTDLGIRLSHFLDENFSNLINLEYTAEMEKGLDSIAEGKLDSVKFLTDFFNNMEEAVGKIEKQSGKLDAVCPKCGSRLVVRTGKYGKFIACSGYPNCKYTERIPSKKQ